MKLWQDQVKEIEGRGHRMVERDDCQLTGCSRCQEIEPPADELRADGSGEAIQGRLG